VSQTTSGSNTHGDLYELDAIAAAIIGGTALTGGRGTIIGSLLGVLIFTQITNLFVINNLQIDSQRIIKGGIIVVAVLIQTFPIASLWRRRKAA
jgi:ribose transport system permease protein